jgi:hypothetical protein
MLSLSPGYPASVRSACWIFGTLRVLLQRGVATGIIQFALTVCSAWLSLLGHFRLGSVDRIEPLPIAYGWPFFLLDRRRLG